MRNLKFAALAALCLGSAPAGAQSQIPTQAPHDWRLLGFQQNQGVLGVMFVDAASVRSASGAKTVVIAVVFDKPSGPGAEKVSKAEVTYEVDCETTSFTALKMVVVANGKERPATFAPRSPKPYTPGNNIGEAAIATCSGDFTTLAPLQSTVEAEAQRWFGQRIVLIQAMTGTRWQRLMIKRQKPNRGLSFAIRESVTRLPGGTRYEVFGTRFNETPMGNITRMDYRMRIDCAAQTAEMVLGEVHRTDGSSQAWIPNIPASPIEPDSEIAVLADAVCTGDWGKTVAQTGPVESLAEAIFAK
ncbi:MAG: hypothetical protein ACAH11_08060 [Sphingomonas sp.]